VRNARQLSAFRFVGALAFLLLLGALQVLRPDTLGPSLALLGSYAAAAGVFWWLGRRRGPWPEVTRWAVPLLDMPAVYLLLRGTAVTLQAAGYVDDASRLALHAPLYFALLIILASLSLAQRQLFVTVAVAAALECALVWTTASDAWFVELTLVLVSLLGLASVAVVASYASRRAIGLLGSLADEQGRLDRLRRYFSPEVAAHVAVAGEGGTAGERCEATVLFADLRDFTALSEPLPPERVVALLNEVHEALVAEVFACGGTLDKYLGDGLMAYFGAPLAQADHAERAVRCALGMQRALATVNKARAARGEGALRLGVGVHSGPVIVGDIGTAQRREFTAIGDAVNVASRLERLTKARQVPILVSEDTRRLAGGRVTFGESELVAVPGRGAPLRVYVPRA
jgi:adenylate cyclase